MKSSGNAVELADKDMMKMRTMRFLPVVSLLICLCPIAVAGSVAESQVRDGDIIFQASRSSQSQAIQRATGSLYSHMGIIFIRQGAPTVYEAVQTVRYTPLQKWIARGEGGHFVVKRLRDDGKVRAKEAVDRLRDAARSFEGKPYDLTFEWSDDRMYCSELVWKIYDRAFGIHLGELRHLREFRLDDAVVRKKLQERYGDAVPLDEPVISPGAMFEAPGLIVILEQ